MKKQPSKRGASKPKTWLITGLLSGLALAYLFFIFLPGQRSLGELRAQVQERHQQITQAQSLARTVVEYG